MHTEICVGLALKLSVFFLNTKLNCAEKNLIGKVKIHSTCAGG